MTKDEIAAAYRKAFPPKLDYFNREVCPFCGGNMNRGKGSGPGYCWTGGADLDEELLRDWPLFKQVQHEQELRAAGISA